MPEVTIDGARLHYLDEGSGEVPVVLLHAFPLRGAMWAPQVTALAPSTRVVVPDLLGFGGSDAPDDLGAYAVEVWADQVAALLDHLGIKRVTLAGLSMGGYAALSFLRRHGQRLAALVLADTRASGDSPEAAQRRRDQIDQVRRTGTAELTETMLGGLLGHHTHQYRPEVVATTRSLMDSSPAGIVGALDAMIRRPDATADLAGIDVPTVIVVGDEDVLSPPDVARSMQEAVSGAELVVIPSAGHLTNLEAPEYFNQALVEVVARCRPGGGHH